ncbi:MAG: hypothetical protein FWE62_03830, partial [Firmicutes bacterium]|nr:hypothetical protein [Bacillota bacterium]
QTKIDNLAEAYGVAYDAAYKSIDGQIKLFDDYAAAISEDTDTVEKMMERWAKQTDNLAIYTKNLQKAAFYGIDEGLVKSLSDGSTESAGYLATMVAEIERLGGSTAGLSEEAAQFVDGFNAAFERTKDAKDSLTTTKIAIEGDFAALIETLEKEATAINFSGFNAAIREAFANVGMDFDKIGQDAAGGLTSGMESGMGEVKGAANDLAQGAVDEVRAALDSHPDSRVMIEVGKDVVGGMITGIESRQKELTQLVKNLSDEISRTMKDSATDTVRDYIAEFSKLPDQTRIRLNELKRVVNDTMYSIPSDMQNIGVQIVDGMINGINSRSSALYSTISSVVSNAIARAKQAAETASPSRKTTRIFEDVGEGMVVGLENKRERIADTARSVVDQALSLDISDKLAAAIGSIDDRMPSITAIDKSGGENRVVNLGGITINAGDMVIREEADVERVAVAMQRLTAREMRKRGLVAV